MSLLAHETAHILTSFAVGAHPYIERGFLAGGIGTTLFYITFGRNGLVSDIAVMARTSSLSKTQLSLIYGGVSAIHAWRMSRDPRYEHFFVRPNGSGAVVGFSY